MRKRPLILIGGVFAFVAIVIAIITVFSFRNVWNPAVEIRNSGDKELRSIRCELFTDESVSWMERIESLAPGERVTFRQETSDLYVQSIEFTIEGTRFEHTSDGLATPRETWVISIDDKGNVTETYE